MPLNLIYYSTDIDFTNKSNHNYQHIYIYIYMYLSINLLTYLFIFISSLSIVFSGRIINYSFINYIHSINNIHQKLWCLIIFAVFQKVIYLLWIRFSTHVAWLQEHCPYSYINITFSSCHFRYLLFEILKIRTLISLINFNNDIYIEGL